MNIQGWLPLGLTDLKGALKRYRQAVTPRAVKSNIPPLSALLRMSESKLSFYIVTEDTFQTAFWKKNPMVPSMLSCTFYFCFLETWKGCRWQDDGRVPISSWFWTVGEVTLTSVGRGEGLFFKRVDKGSTSIQVKRGKSHYLQANKSWKPKILIIKSFLSS